MPLKTQEIITRIKSVRGDFRLDPAHKESWTQALRSGQYAQGRGSLCRESEEGNYFCCLGVLLDQASAPFSTTASHTRRYTDHGASAVSERLIPVLIQNILVGANDVHLLTFDEIADAIEEAL